VVQPPNRHESRTTCTFPTSRTRVPPVLDHASDTIRSTTYLHRCVSRVSATTVSHPSSSVPLVESQRSSFVTPSPSARTRITFTFVVDHRPCASHTCTPQTDIHGCTIQALVLSLVQDSHKSTTHIDNHLTSTQTIRDKSTLFLKSPP
jgi:hypothetical protein